MILLSITHLVVNVDDCILPDNLPIVYWPLRRGRHSNSRHECRKDGRDPRFICLLKISVTSHNCARPSMTDSFHRWSI